ncbi:MAG TPA: carbohydrate kinase [Spirochaetaceae bacterium]|nr:carbohydrate kinase [Spirochaetaceae bacterium]
MAYSPIPVFHFIGFAFSRIFNSWSYNVIICCGENLIDMVPESGTDNHKKAPYGSFRVAPGGCPYNSAIAAARLGADVQFLGSIASDFLGDKLFARLVENGVGTEMVVRAQRPVTLAFVEKSTSGEARYAFYAEGCADRSIKLDDLPAALPREAHFLLAGSISLVLEPAASTIAGLIERESDKLLVSFDPNIRASLIPDREGYLKKFEALCASCAIVKASDSDLEWLYGSVPTGEIVSHILDLGPEAVFVTLGEKGSIAFTRRVSASIEAFKIPIIDTIGAGDTFHAAILAALDRKGIASRAALSALGEKELFALLRFASAAAAINCTREGTDPPRFDEIELSYPGCGL